MKRETLIAAAVFAAIPLVVLCASVLCSWAIAEGAAAWWRVPFRLLCHGIPHRCFTIFAVPMPICARCTGIYLGMFAGLAAFLMMPYVPERLLRVSAFTAAAVLAIDGLTQLARLRESTNGLRLATGLAAGATFGMWVLSAIERRDKRVTASP